VELLIEASHPPMDIPIIPDLQRVTVCCGDCAVLRAVPLTLAFPQVHLLQ
jgi:hypothetical protein